MTVRNYDGGIPPVSSIKMNRQDIWDAVTVVYPVCKQGLEIECEDGYKLSVGRKRDQNLWGISSKDFMKDWVENKVNTFCRQMKPTEMDYNDNTFDMVINNNDLGITKKSDAKKMMSIIKKICSGKAFLNLPITKKLDKSWWLKTICQLKFTIECFHITTQKTLVVELQC